MNRSRHARRAAAKARSRLCYQGRILAALNEIEIEPGQVSLITVEHDEDCTFEAGRCTCVPDISRRSGDRLQRIGLDGEVEESPLC